MVDDAVTDVGTPTVDLPAIRANLKQLGHDIDEESILSMLQDLDINHLLGSVPRTAAAITSDSAPGNANPASSITAVDTPTHNYERSRHRSQPPTAMLTKEKTSYRAQHQSRAPSVVTRISTRIHSMTLTAALSPRSQDLETLDDHPSALSDFRSVIKSSESSESVQSDLTDAAEWEHTHAASDKESDRSSNRHGSASIRNHALCRVPQAHYASISDYSTREASDEEEDEESDGFYLSTRSAKLVCHNYFQHKTVLYKESQFLTECY